MKKLIDLIVLGSPICAWGFVVLAAVNSGAKRPVAALAHRERSAAQPGTPFFRPNDAVHPVLHIREPM